MAYTPTVYTNDASSPDLDATNLNKSEQGIKIAHLMSVPVDCSSRVAEYTGDGIPLIPDNAAGTVYKQDAWATTDGWTGSGATLSVSGGNLVMTATATSANAIKSMSFGSNNLIRVRIKTSRAAAIILQGTVGGTPNVLLINRTNAKLNLFQEIDVFVTGALTALIIRVDGQTVGDLTYVDIVYVGSGLYDTPAKDRAGNGNSLTNTAVTPVNGKYGKEMSFNGTTSFLQASSPVIGTTGTVAVRFKRNTLVNTTVSIILSNYKFQDATGISIHIEVSGMLAVYIGDGVGVQVLNIKTISDLIYHTFILKINGSHVIHSIDNEPEITTPQTSRLIATTDFYVGSSINGGFFNGVISHFRYDSRIWTADEALAWSLNPISIDSRV